MVDPTTHRFYYACVQGKPQHAVHPVRDLAAAWDATKAIGFWSSDWWSKEEENHDDGDIYHYVSTLSRAVQETLAAYDTVGVAEHSTALRINVDRVETSHLGHSALYILATVQALRLGLIPDSAVNRQRVEGLVQGILHQQRPDGAFVTTFCHEDGKRDNTFDSENVDNSIRVGIEFYPGQALLALLQVQRWGALPVTTQAALLPSVERALNFYSKYHQTYCPDVNYAIWQLQACAFYDRAVSSSSSSSSKKSDMVYHYQQAMTTALLSSRLWQYDLLKGPSYYPNLSTLAVVCGLDALADIYGENSTKTDDPEEHVTLRIERAVQYLGWSLDRSSSQGQAFRGLGYGGWQHRGGVVNRDEQRLDVSGHAISALIKLQVGHVRATP